MIRIAYNKLYRLAFPALRSVHETSASLIELMTVQVRVDGSLGPCASLYQPAAWLLFGPESPQSTSHFGKLLHAIGGPVFLLESR